MTDEQFDALVGRLEQQACRRPTLYKIKVLLLALLGYGYIFLVLTLLLTMTVASVVFLKAIAVHVIISILLLLWVVVRSLWVRIDPPAGITLKRRDAPALFELIDDLQRRLHAPRFHTVLITDEFNASVMQVPRLGIFGWHRNFLLIGLPLMKSLTPAQFRAVLAHEMGHLAGGHGRISNWLYRLRMSWARLLETLEEHKSISSFLFRPFFNWFMPCFNAWSFPLARANEYEADAAAARLGSPRVMAEALTGIDIVYYYLGQRFWPHIHGQADELPQPAFAPYAVLGDSLAGGLDDDDIDEWLKQAMLAQTETADTHPSLADRLKALGEEPRIALPEEGKAADRLLGDGLARLTSELDRRWRDAISPSWKEHHQQVQQGRAQLKELDLRARNGEQLSLQEAYDRARLTESYGQGADAAMEQFEQLHALEPDNSIFCYELGYRLLQKDDERGYDLVVRAVEGNENLIVDGCELLRDYSRFKGRQEQARTWHERMLERSLLEAQAQLERDTLMIRDKLEHHGLPEEAVAALRQQLQALGGVRKAWLVRKKVKLMPEHPCYVLGYTTTPWWRPCSQHKVEEIQQRILDSLEFPDEMLVVNVEGYNYRFGRKLYFRRGARIL